MYFNFKNLTFQLKCPAYEEKNFGFKVGELRLVEHDPSRVVLPMDEFWYIMNKLELGACTLRGKEDINLIRYLNDLGFEFVGTYRYFECKREDFKPCAYGDIIEVDSERYDDVLFVERNVFDYSTYQIDDRFNRNDTVTRNVNRVKSYFDNPNHYCYGILDTPSPEDEGHQQLIGFIQFIVDPQNRTAENVNSALMDQNKGLGKILYSEGFKRIFDLWSPLNDASHNAYAIDKVTGWVSAQNPRPAKILDKMGFRFIDQEIHLRWKKS